MEVTSMDTLWTSKSCRYERQGNAIAKKTERSQIGAVGKRLSNKIANDIAMALTACAFVTIEWSNLVLDQSVIEEDGFPW